MTPPNNNADPNQVYNSRDEWVECPKCRAVMLPLGEYELQSASEFPTIDAEPWEFLLFGWIVFVCNFALGLLTYGSRKAKLVKVKRDVLPRFPSSLVCPRCFDVQRRL